MNIPRKLKIFALTATVGLFGLEAGTELSIWVWPVLLRPQRRELAGRSRPSASQALLGVRKAMRGWGI